MISYSVSIVFKLLFQEDLEMSISCVKVPEDSSYKHINKNSEFQYKNT